MGELVKFLKSKVFFLNLIIAILLAASIIGFTYKWLDGYTKHGETISVPDLRGLLPEEAKEFLSRKHLNYAIIDSMFDLKKTKGIILDQDPAPNAKVKENRTIYLTVNSILPPQVKMPNLIDVSYRQAEAILQTYGLKVGELIYKPDLAKNAVIGQQANGVEIKPGTLINKGSVVDLILGDGLGNTKVTVPNLINLTLEEALFVLKASSLNVGSIVADETVKDSSLAKVYRQIPSFSDATAALSQGESVDLFITQPPENIKDDK